MNIDDKIRLSMLGDMSKAACSRRLIAARQAAGLTQTELADASRHKTNAINNMEKERQFPNREVMRYLYRSHRIDFNFVMHGDFSQLPADIQERLFDVLANYVPESEDASRDSAPGPSGSSS